MNKSRSNYRWMLLTLLGFAVSLQSCGLFGKKNKDSLESRINGSRGEIYSFSDVRKNYSQYIPSGMVVVPSGTFHMGQADEDPASSQINYNKQITISAFFMDQTEVTNNQYRFFVDLAIAYSGGDPESDDAAESIPSDYEEEVMNKIFENQATGSLDVPSFDDVKKKIHPDVDLWVKEYAHHMGDPLMEYYYMHPAFDDYPVVGVDWYAANLFCQWRTLHLSYYKQVQKGEPYAAPRFRLPTEAEWEYAARGGRDMAKYPWGGPYVRNTLGCMLANFKPGRGNYYDDGFAYTGPVAQYFPNDYGLYDMAGNVAEWCQDAYYESSVPVVWDINPVFNPPTSEEAGDLRNRRVVRGGSWKDIAYYCETGTKTWQHWDSASTSIGFRCAMTYLGRSSGDEF
ncbi:SUMF1/EgtB/PvdO family nonheme iron enzyme [Eisenibacter elegans]|jgi:gliding motility-associated lipoprotein GldK|uniref:type IX secretion system lipoprotein PorK/GldK n=1 Tax=Eisenibacter elegans TaxID=997 RepID=UPI00047D044E|nr:SUMF1/EgtB/PvdO family nonheme iron enzyme [Eisenibacter elegans]